MTSLPRNWMDVARYLAEREGITEPVTLNEIEAEGDNAIVIRTTINGRTVVFRPTDELGRVLRSRLRMTGPKGRPCPIATVEVLDEEGGTS